jgi:hypothetical protein
VAEDVTTGSPVVEEVKLEDTSEAAPPEEAVEPRQEAVPTALPEAIVSQDEVAREDN